MFNRGFSFMTLIKLIYIDVNSELGEFKCFYLNVMLSQFTSLSRLEFILGHPPFLSHAFLHTPKTYKYRTLLNKTTVILLIVSKNETLPDSAPLHIIDQGLHRAALYHRRQ